VRQKAGAAGKDFRFEECELLGIRKLHAESGNRARLIESDAPD
jgi:hypothetical protein